MWNQYKYNWTRHVGSIMSSQALQSLAVDEDWKPWEYKNRDLKKLCANMFLIAWIFNFPIKHFKISHLILTGRSSTGRCWCWPGCLGCSSTPSQTRPCPPWWWGTACPRPGAWPGRHVATLFVLKCQHRQLSTPNSWKERSLVESRRPALEF